MLLPRLFFFAEDFMCMKYNHFEKYVIHIDK